MTKKQMLAECRRLAPDFTMRFERPDGVDTLVVSCTASDEPLALSMHVGGLGRAAVETELLERSLSALRRRAA